MRPSLLSAALLTCLLTAGLLPAAEAADLPALTYRHDHFLFTIDPDTQPHWRQVVELWSKDDIPTPLPQVYRVDGDHTPPLPEGYERRTETRWNRAAIARTIVERISNRFDRPAGSVTIGRNEQGRIVFDGVGLTGRSVNVEAAVAATLLALDTGVRDIFLDVTETQPQITVTAEDLKQQGITEVVTIGESNFAGSPQNRRHNIAVGLEKFNGTLIPKDSVFSFNKILGRVDGAAGYRKELVIKGDRTEPDYGGGLCQVSSTAYRGAWEAGFPIAQRKNHSYNVSYYGPVGTDATVYPPNPDMKFTNDGPSDLLIQTHQANDRAYFIYYGTRDTRRAQVWGPIILSTRAAPPDKTVFTSDLPPGQKRKVGDRHPGVTALWFRSTVRPDETLVVERTLSVYEARPLFYEIGSPAPAAPVAPPVNINTPEPPRVF